MNPRAWDSHKTKWCARCRHDRPRKPCPALAILDKDPEDPVCNKLFRDGRCTQFGERPAKEPRRQRTRRKR